MSAQEKPNTQRLEQAILDFTACRKDLDEVNQRMAGIRAQLLIEQGKKMRLEDELRKLRALLSELEEDV